MGLIDTISNLPLIRQFFNQQTVTTSTEAGGSSRATLMQQFAVSDDRRSIIRDCRQMYGRDSRIREAISRIARDVMSGGFRIEFAPKDGTDAAAAETATEIVKNLVTRLDLATRLDDWIRLTERDGDTFLEVSIDRSFLIQKLTRKPTLAMHRNSNSQDEFDDPTRAFFQVSEIWAGLSLDRLPKDAIVYAAWQIIHARLMHDEGSRYGTPRFTSAREAWKLVNRGERDMGIRRATRATMRYSHEVQGATSALIDAYIAKNKVVAEDPNAATKDFYGAKVTAVQGDSTLGEVSDLKWHLDNVASASPVPFALMMGGEDLNRDILEDQSNAYDETLTGYCGWVVTDFIRPVVELQLLLLGIWPDDLEMTVIWAREEELAAKKAEGAARASEQAALAVAKAGEAGIKLQAIGWPAEVIDRVIVEIIAPVLPEMTKEELADLIKQHRADQDPIFRFDKGAGDPAQKQNPEPATQNGKYPVLLRP